VEKYPLPQQIFSDWYCIAGFVTLLSAFAAIGVDQFLRGEPERRSKQIVVYALALAAFVWAGCLLAAWIWRLPMASGWNSANDAAIGAALVLGLLVCMRSLAHARVATAALFVLALVEYKAFGTSRRINSINGPTRTLQSERGWAGFNPKALEHMFKSQPLRVTVDELGAFPTDWRHARVASVNGFDPFLPVAYQKLLESRGAKFTSNRLFELPRDVDTLRLLGVGFYVTAEASPSYKELFNDPNFTLYESAGDYYKVFALKDPQPPYAFPGGSVRLDRWTPERRRFDLESANGGRFRLSENFYPGWQATIDGKPANITQCETAFQCVEVPAGKHLLQFLYRPRTLRWGAGITLTALVALIALAWRRW
jgi:hypothetical protein